VTSSYKAQTEGFASGYDFFDSIAHLQRFAAPKGIYPPKDAALRVLRAGRLELIRINL
jgi:hypothetical protein